MCETIMKWEEFYENFYCWADSIQVNRISQLTTFGCHEQVAEIVQSYYDEKAGSRLAKKAIAAGVRFNPAEIVDMQDSVNKECMNMLVNTAMGDFTQEQVEELVFSMDDKIYAYLEKRYCHYDDEDEDDCDDVGESTNSGKKPDKLFGIFAFAGMASAQGLKNKGPRFRVGDHVRVRWRGQEGTIIDINGGLYMVSLDNGRTIDSFPESALEKTW